MRSIVLSVEDTRRIVQELGLDNFMDEVIGRLRQAFREFDTASSWAPPRAGFHYREPVLGLLEWMPIMDAAGRATIKIVGYHPDNPDRNNLPTILSTIASYDTKTGHLQAIADGTFVTAVRTGAASAIASEILCSPTSHTLGLIGCGAQAITQLHALSRVAKFRQVLFYDSDAAVSASFADRTKTLGLRETRMVEATLDELLKQSDVICTTTSVDVGAGPVFDDCELKPWVHINAVGSDFPDKIELPLSLLRRSFVCPDYPEQARREGECQQLTDDEIGASLVELVKNPRAFDAQRESPTVFDSTGWALQDHVVMEILIDHARRLRLGTPIHVESNSADPRDPYHFLVENGLQEASSDGQYSAMPTT